MVAVVSKEVEHEGEVAEVEKVSSKNDGNQQKKHYFLLSQDSIMDISSLVERADVLTRCNIMNISSNS
jgi:hypothetical protein